ncbi:peptidylprolyl isomerase [Synechococcus sp. CS-1328]|uniref:peptidylprolyl isomerase n=1 Tax=Synechococcus sp. CS-1328 TaxID=2847976 RepID=UPI00223B1551|nr:peptidylprolyl isomerase [Synechococcus sp. CS-1328]MCT0224363.1 peptidylprolyl isomerase [Synechococcus sp. CS-1328]
MAPSPSASTAQQAPIEQDHALLIEIPPGRPWMSVAELNRLMRQQGLVLAVAQASIYDEVMRTISLDPETVEDLVHQYLEREEVNGPEGLAAFLARKGIAEEDMRYFATKGHRLEIFKQRLFEAEVEIRFLERKLDLDRVIYSLIRVEEQHVAEELHQRILEGESDFADLAERFSLGQERHTKGRVGPVSFTTAHEEVVKRLRVSRPGQLLEPFQLVNMWLLLRLEHWFPAELNDATRSAMRDELFAEWFETRVMQLMAGEPLPPLPSHLLASA